MKTAKKLAGFFIVEILIVLVIIGILVTALMPNLTTYTQRAQYMDNVTAADAIKASVEGCLLQNYTAFTNCDGGSSGIPTYATPYGGFVQSVVVTNGIITATSTGKFGPTAAVAYSYTLTPTATATGGITWSDADGLTPGCKAAGLC